MNIITAITSLVDRHIVSVRRKRSCQSLLQMSDRELEDIGLPRECLYQDSANQHRHMPKLSPIKSSSLNNKHGRAA